MLANGKTQQQVAEEMGWSPSKVSNYALLEKISPVVWNVISTAFSSSVEINNENLVATFPTGVGITETLLRSILSLTEHHQLRIIQELINGNIKNGQVKKLATTYAERESLAEYAIENLLCKADVPVFFKDCLDGLYKDQQQIEKAVKQAFPQVKGIIYTCKYSELSIKSSRSSSLNGLSSSINNV